MDNHDSFEQYYFCHHTDMPNLDNGDKIIMPLSSLDRLANLKIDYPMLFETLNPKTGRVSHCGVLEFTAEEGTIYTPQWMMKNMGLEEGDVVLIKSASLPKGTYIKLQPHKKEFIELSNPKALLEAKLRNFSCLSTNDTIMLMHNNKKFYIDVVQTKPGFAISVIETDCEVDFAIPLDCTEPEKSVRSEIVTEEKETEFRPFTGTARRIDGSSTTILNTKKVRMEDGAKVGARKRMGKLVFGSNEVQNLEKPATVSKNDESSENEKKFEPFKGKKHTLAE